MWTCAQPTNASVTVFAVDTAGTVGAASTAVVFPVVVDVPVGKGHVVLFAANPIYRGETIGGYAMVFNTILNFDSLNAGRKLDAK